MLGRHFSRSFSSSLQVEMNPHKLAAHLSGKHLINGSFVESKDTFDVQNPATGEVIGQAASAGKEEVEAAVQSSQKAFLSWKKMTGRQRGELVRQVGEKLDEHKEELAMLTALETGKALRTESRVEAGVLSDSFKFFGGLGGELKGMTIPWSQDSLTYTQQEPYGVTSCVVPWNAPLMLCALKISPAMVAGNTCIVKTAEEAPLGLLRVCEIANSILPPGVFNILSGDGPTTGGPLVQHPLVKKVSFTGSVETGRIIYGHAAQKLIPATLELGGKSPMMVLPDCDMKATIAGAVGGMRFTRAGQSCTAASRMFVHADVYDEFVEGVKSAVNAMVMGDPLDESTDMGTIISQSQFDKVHSYIELGKNTPGAKAHVLNQLPKDPKFKNGLFVQPVIFTDIDNECRVSREEIFGPVSSIIRYTDYEDALRQANDTEFGLAATVWTSSLKTAMHSVSELEAGLVQVNQAHVLQCNLPNGGMKNSGLGREGALEDMINHFTKPKTVSINKLL